MVGKKIFKIGKQIIEDEDDSIQVISTEIVKEASVESKVAGNFNPKIFNPGIYNPGHITPRLFKPDISTPEISTPDFSTLNSSYPHFSIIKLGRGATKNLGRARPPKHWPAQSIFIKSRYDCSFVSLQQDGSPVGVKITGLEVEKYGVVMSCNT
jgi:hypothetical protein